MGWGSLAFLPAAAGRLAVPVVVAGLACVAPADAGPDLALPRTPAPSAAPPAKPAAKPVAMPPIVFFLAKGDANACGPGCSEWIAAEGTIDVGADGRLRALLNKLGRRRPPIYFHSPGGAITGGLGIGRILRQHGLTAGVGRTVPAGCDRNAAHEPACDKLKRSGRELVADLDTASTLCNSACVFSLVGAVVRDVDPGASLGIHSASITFSLRRIDSKGHVTRTPTHVAAKVENRALQENYDRIAAYMREMGIAPGLLDAARKVPSDHIRYLSRDEIVAFGIDRRELIEGLWEFVDSPTGAAAVKIVQWREAAAFRRVILRASCSTPDTVRFQFARELGGDRAVSPDRLRVTFGTSDLPLGRAFMTAPLTGWQPLEVRTAYLPIAILHEAALVIEASPSTATSAATSATSSASAAKVTAQNIGSGLRSLASRCMAAPAASSAVEHI